MDYVCIPGSSHGGIGLPPGYDALHSDKAYDQRGYALYSDQTYDQQDTVSLLGGSGGEINYFKITLWL